MKSKNDSNCKCEIGAFQVLLVRRYGRFNELLEFPSLDDRNSCICSETRVLHIDISNEARTLVDYLYLRSNNDTLSKLSIQNKRSRSNVTIKMKPNTRSYHIPFKKQGLKKMYAHKSLFTLELVA